MVLNGDIFLLFCAKFWPQKNVLSAAPEIQRKQMA